MSRPEDFPPPPPIKNVVFDDDIWHPLDHRIGDARCRSFQGGNARKAIRMHWKYEWDFGPWHDKVAKWPHKVLCLLGRHHYITWWRGPGSEQFGGRNCWWCHKQDPDLITHERII